MNTTAKSDLPIRRSPGFPVSPTADSPLSELHDCWNTIGVAGDQSCARLKEIVHCRNCPDYSAAGVRLLNRAPPSDYQREWTQHFAQPKKLLGTARVSVLLFRVGPEWLALPTHVFQEVAEHRLVHSLPHRSRRPGSTVLGLVNIRGQLILCVSVGRLLNLQQEIRTGSPCKLYPRLVVSNWNGHRLTFPVEEVHGIHRYHPHEVKQVPATLAPVGPTYTRGVLPWRDKSVGCLEEESFFAALNRSLA
jgi:chemotaxis-related protein WspD